MSNADCFTKPGSRTDTPSMLSTGGDGELASAAAVHRSHVLLAGKRHSQTYQVVFLV